MMNLGFYPVCFYGVVESRLDPLKLGRLQVRIYSWHSNNKEILPTNYLPWAQVSSGITSASMGDVGRSPTGSVEGTWVHGYFMDGKNAQRPLILGTLPGIPKEFADPSKAFNDPNGVYPKRIDEPDVNSLARGGEHQTVTTRNETRSTAIETSDGETWDEPVSAYASEYPYNQVWETESGHIFEADDTEGHERISEYHRIGTFYEVDNLGNKVTRVVANNYTVIAGSDYAYIKGNVNLTIDGNCNTKIDGDWNISVGGDINETVLGNKTTNATNVNETVTGLRNTAASVLSEVAATKTSNVSGDVTENTGGRRDCNVSGSEFNLNGTVKINGVVQVGD